MGQDRTGLDWNGFHHPSIMSGLDWIGAEGKGKEGNGGDRERIGLERMGWEGNGMEWSGIFNLTRRLYE